MTGAIRGHARAASIARNRQGPGVHSDQPRGDTDVVAALRHSMHRGPPCPNPTTPCSAIRSPTRCRRARSEENTSELQSLMSNTYAVFCLKKQKIKHNTYKLHNLLIQHKELE